MNYKNHTTQKSIFFFAAITMAIILFVTAGCGNRGASITDEIAYDLGESFFDGTQDSVSKDVMKKAEADIEKYRKGDFTIRFVTENGKEIKRAKANIELFQHQFIFGTNMRRLSDMPDDSKIKHEALQSIIDIFNTIHVCNYWEEQDYGKPADFSTAMMDYEWATRNNIRTRHHAILYNVPSWIPADKKLTEEDYWNMIEFRIKDVAENFGGKIFLYDVMNEMFHRKSFSDRIRDVNPNFPDFTDPQVAKRIYDLTRKYLPDAKLVVLEALNSTVVNNPAIFRFVNYCKALRDVGCDFDYVGHQAHFFTRHIPFQEGHLVHGEDCFTMVAIDKSFDLLASVGKPVVITEFNGPTRNRKQPREEQEKLWTMTDHENSAWQINFYRLAFSKPYILELTRWVHVDDVTGNAMDGGILDRNGDKRQIYYDLKKLIKEEWHTKVDDKTNKKGEIAWRGFYGEYDIKIKGYHPIRMKLYDDNKEKIVKIVLKKSYQ